MTKTKQILMGLSVVLVVAVGVFGLSACGSNGGKTIPNGTYSGVSVNEGVFTGDDFSTYIYNWGIIDEISPNLNAGLVISSDNVIAITIGAGNVNSPGFINTNVTGFGSTEWKYVLSGNNLTLQFKQSGGSWTNWNGSVLASVTQLGTTVNKTLVGTFNKTTGKITIVCKATQGSNSISRTFEFAK